jgi:hypothetical protein
LTIVGRLVVGPDALFGLESPVEVVWDDMAPGFAVPEFKLVTS